MNVGSILNGESPPESTKGEKPAGALHHRHSINNLLNDASDSKKEKNGDVSDDSISEDSATEREINEAIKESEKEEQEKKETAQEKQLKASAPLPVPKKAPAIERKQIVDSELKKISKLKEDRAKPKRYTEPPIWAQRYYPPNQGPKDGYKANAPVPTGQNPVFDRESMYLADLECLITGVIPPQSTVRTIAEWLYANFVEISLENRQYVELELKFGTIMGKNTGARLDIGVSSECIYTATADTRFEMGVHDAGWADLKEFLNELERAYVDEAKKNPSRPRRKFNTTESDTTDYFFHVSERNEKPQKIRITKDNGLVPPRYVGIQKKRLSDIYIHNPLSVYDLRLSLSLEMPVNEASVEPLMKKKPTLQRGKKRTSFSHAPTVTRFDFTEVLLPKKTKNKFGKTVVENDRSYELELEIDTYQIFRGFDKIRDGSDTIRFEELVEIFLNNARCLNNRVTKLASK